MCSLTVVAVVRDRRHLVVSIELPELMHEIPVITFEVKLSNRHVIPAFSAYSRFAPHRIRILPVAMRNSHSRTRL